MDITERALLIRINQRYYDGISAAELYDVTRGVWRKNRKFEDAEIALAVYKGEVKVVYRIEAWHIAGTTPYQTRGYDDVYDPDRVEFTGKVAEPSIRRKYLGQSVKKYFKYGNRSPVVCVNID
jgi:hypothetical protein